MKNFYYKIARIFPPIRLLKIIYTKLRYPNEPKRYNYLFDIIRENKCRRIMEIGTWNGNRALQMIGVAQKYHSNNEVEYYGFDLFEMMNDEIFEREVSKRPSPMAEVRDKLEATGAKIFLFRGFTEKTMPEVVPALPKMDFVFIDGGHSIETITNDWNYTQGVMGQNTVVIFDDYWSGEWAHRKDAGCRNLIEKLDRSKFDVRILPIQDKFKKNWGILQINFVEVKKLTASM